MQFVALWNCRQPTKVTTVPPERGSTSDDWYTAYGAHHASSAVAALATGPATDFVQAGGIGSQVPQWGAPAYLADDCRLIHCRRSGLRSSSSATKPEVPLTRTTFGDRSFAVDGPRVWNSLPATIHDPSLTLAVFSNIPKTHLFNIVAAASAILNRHLQMF